MNKLIATLIALFVMPLALSACGGGDTSTDAGKPASSSSSKPVDLSGNWAAEGFEAVIDDNYIEINIVTSDSKSVYWVGTFPAVVNDKVTSAADKDALSESMLGSTADEKVFTIDGDKIEFEIKMAGTTKKIKLEKA